jgi:alpha-glucosidase
MRFRKIKPLYKVVPFILGYKTNKPMVFSSTIHLELFDFVMKEETSFWSEGGEMNYYFIYGPQMEDVVKLY